ncbi:MAG: glycosyltransferase [Bacteriovoracaceae bacterium]|nr:glycosyltransferase [Bacteriovoracaceae bacterium]
MKQKIRVLQIVRVPVGGIRKHIMLIINNLNQQKFESLLATHLEMADCGFHESLNPQTLPKENIFSLTITQRPAWQDLKNLWQLYKFYKCKTVHVIHGHGAKGGFYARILGFLLHKPVLYTAHGGSLHEMHGKINNLFYQLIEKFLYYFTSKFVFESQYSMDIFKRRINDNQQKYILNYNGLTLNQHVNDNKPDKNAPILIGAFGQLRNIKGHDLLVRAIKILTQEGFNVAGVIFGEGEEQTNLINLATTLGIEDRIEIKEHTPNIEEQMRKCSIIVQPSRYESFGYVAAEAMSLGIPCVAANTGGLPEIITHKVSGLLFQVDDARDLAVNIKTYITDGPFTQSVIKEGVKVVAQKFNAETMTKNLENIYQEPL